MNFSLRVAIRFLRSSKGQTFLIVLGIAIGVSVQIFIGSLIQGLQISLLDATIGSSPHLTVTTDSDDGLIDSYETIQAELPGYDARIRVVSPVLDQPGLILTDGQSRSLRMRGLEFDRADDLYKLEDKLVDGTFPVGPNEALVGTTLLQELDLQIGDTLEVTIQDDQRQTYRIAGVLDLQVAVLNETWFLTSLDSLQTLFGQEGLVTSIEMQVEDGTEFEADAVRTLVEQNLPGSGWTVTDWKTQNEQLLSGLNGQSVSSAMIQVFVIISVVLGIASVLAISVIQRSRQIGILKAMGVRNRQASLIFLFQGLILGSLGGLAGVLVGLGLAYSFTVFAVNPDGTPVVDLYLNPSFFALSFLIAVTASSVAALIPAAKSARLNPIEVIRNG